MTGLQPAICTLAVGTVASVVFLRTATRLQAGGGRRIQVKKHFHTATSGEDFRAHMSGRTYPPTSFYGEHIYSLSYTFLFLTCLFFPPFHRLSHSRRHGRCSNEPTGQSARERGRGSAPFAVDLRAVSDF